MIFVYGLWGDGTSLAAKVIEAQGCYLGVTKYQPDARNKYGCMEDSATMQELMKDSGVNLERVERAIKGTILHAESKGLLPAMKSPWYPVRPEVWELMAEHGTKLIRVSRPSKDPETYDMNVSYHGIWRRNEPLMRHRLARLESYHLDYDALMADPDGEEAKLAAFLGVEPAGAARELCDPGWPRAVRLGDSGVRTHV